MSESPPVPRIVPGPRPSPATRPWALALLVALGVLLRAPPAAAQEGSFPPPPADTVFRVATWNIEHFPSEETDVERVGEVLLGLDADLVAVQEIEDTVAFRELLSEVNETSSEAAEAFERRARRYGVAYSSGGGAGGQYVGLVHDSASVELDDVRSLERLRMSRGLRPALAAEVKSRRGGLDFLSVANHLDSGTGLRDYRHRMEFYDSLRVVLAGERPDDPDFVVLGDLNTMGRDAGGGERAVPAEEELAILDRTLEEIGLRRLPARPPCSEYYRRRGGLLDHILVTASMREAPPYGVAEVYGYCRDLSCRPYPSGEAPADYEEASDHCPVVVDLVDRDWE